MSLRSLLVAALATLAMAAPAPEIQARQGMTSNELENGPCRDVTFIFARGSVEQGNMVCLSRRRSPFTSVTELTILGFHRGTGSLQRSEERSRLRQGCLSGCGRRIYRPINPERPSPEHGSGIHQGSHGYVRPGQHQVSEYEDRDWWIQVYPLHMKQGRPAANLM